MKGEIHRNWCWYHWHEQRDSRLTYPQSCPANWVHLTFCVGPKKRGGGRGAGRVVQQGVGQYGTGHRNQDGIGSPLRYLARPGFRLTPSLP